jgi:predicted AAA+ superfamily ATPase
VSPDGASYLPRVIDDELDALFPHLAAIALEGAKGVGKTATAIRRARTVHRLDEPGELAVIEAEPGLIAGSPRPVLVDEWQRVPATWDVVRRAVDDRAPGGSFLLTGSATPLDGPAHSGAGRIVRARMRPLSLAERALDVPTVSLSALLTGDRPQVQGRTTVDLRAYTREIVASGLPGLRGLPDRPRRAQLDSYIDQVVDRDVADAGARVRSPATLRRWLAAYAAATATTASYDTIRDAATSGEHDKPAKSTTQPYRDTLQRIWILDPLPAWLPTRNTLSRLSSPPKHHVLDPALAARLVGADLASLLEGASPGPAVPRDGTLLGALFESLVTLSVRVYAQAAEASVGHLRTRGGRQEVDLIVARADQQVVAIEVKLGGVVDDRDVRHLRWLREQLDGDLLDAVVVNTGPAAYRRPDGIAVVPAALLGP